MANTKKKSPAKKTQSKPAPKKPATKPVKKPTKPQVKKEVKAEVKPEPKVETPQPQAKKGKKKFLIPLVCVLGVAALAGAGVGIYFAVKGDKAKKVEVVVPEINGLVVDKLKAYVGKDYDTGISVDKTLTDWLLPDELTKVTSGNRTITNKEYTYDVADNKETAKLHIPGKYIEDTITITLELVEPTPVDPYVVNETEFEAALALTGVEYLQTKAIGEVLDITTSEECSPNIYHYIARMHFEQPVYNEFYTYKIDENTYKKISRSDETTPWGGISWEDADKEEWSNPQKIGTKIIQATGTIEFDPSKYDPSTHSYTLKNTTEQEFVFKFENKKLISINFVGSNEMTFDYEEVTPELPIPAPTI